MADGAVLPRVKPPHLPATTQETHHHHHQVGLSPLETCPAHLLCCRVHLLPQLQLQQLKPMQVWKEMKQPYLQQLEVPIPKLLLPKVKVQPSQLLVQGWRPQL